MTLGGLALAVGILVDNSTVTIENTHRVLDEGMEYDKGIEEGAAGIALPTLVSTLAISCVFVSVVFLEGAPRYLFTPQGYAVVFAMLGVLCHFTDACPDHQPRPFACGIPQPRP